MHFIEKLLIKNFKSIFYATINDIKAENNALLNNNIEVR